LWPRRMGCGSFFRMVGKYVWRAIGAANFALFFANMFFLGNVLPIVSKYLIKPLFPGFHEQLKCQMAEIMFATITDWSEVVGGLKVIVTGDKIPDGSAVLISNHVSYSDSIAIHCIAHRHTELGHVRPFAKSSLAYVPIFGWFGVFLNYIFLSRSWDHDKIRIRQQLNDLTRKAKLYASGNFWLMLFPEGTRLRPKKLAEAQEFSKKRGLPVLENLLVPRNKGWVSSMDGTREAITGVIDMTIGYSQWTKTGHARPSVGDCMFALGGEWPVHVHVRYFPVKTIPEGQEAESQWLQDRWNDKDKLLEAFKRDGHFPGEIRPLKKRTLLDAFLNYLAMILIALTTRAALVFVAQHFYKQDWAVVAQQAQQSIETLLLAAK